eukprot:CAMPEP_0198318900 /NCGR_PEP_ID=MMETSP1450-20131203/8147_1 /TAXON_ID=753684 ORGANISM="Madagascaria erythrocladiodes, Strain CCMP3234" /NCGR_SAMPLE_ID=MMETSP1450 /ASSEMBLY_ACC=CAM_ASM_001115 /LENGTH=370 /DNA_ID=CAMNT_0044022247 /DNA_START=60 /DNA_END=1170 /DNA_ORIENTATION=+
MGEGKPTSSVRDLDSVQDVDVVISRSDQALAVNFWAAWAQPCEQMNEVFEALADLYKDSNIDFVRVDAERVPEVIDKYNVAAVPTFSVYLPGDKEEAARVEGANAQELTLLLSELAAGRVQRPSQKPKQTLEARLKDLVSSAPVMLFMKGTPDQPRCGFSRTIVGILRDQGISFDTFDILQDQEVRAGLKTFSQWPTFPQLYSNGTFIGGLDVVKDLVEEGSFKDELESAPEPAVETKPVAVPEAPKKPSHEEVKGKLRRLINSNDIMLFMKGSPEQPKCGFSSKIVQLLDTERIPYGTFDILTDMEVRQGLKELSDWPTYPQLYAKGNLIGGLDIIQELQATGELKGELGAEAVEAGIRSSKFRSYMYM